MKINKLILLGLILLLYINLSSQVLYSSITDAPYIDNGLDSEKTLITFLTPIFDKQITNEKTKTRISLMIRNSLSQACSNMRIRTDFGFNNKNLSSIERIRLDKEVKSTVLRLIEERAFNSVNQQLLQYQTTSRYVFYCNVVYNSQSLESEYELYYTIVHLDDMTQIPSSIIGWRSDQVESSLLQNLLMAEFSKLPLCRIFELGKDNYDHLDYTLKNIALIKLYNPNDKTIDVLINNHILSDIKLKTLYFRKFEQVLINALNESIPEGSELSKVDKYKLKYYFDLLSAHFQYMVNEFPKLRQEYIRKLNDTQKLRSDIGVD